jgi:hypothetical protein
MSRESCRTRVSSWLIFNRMVLLEALLASITRHTAGIWHEHQSAFAGRVRGASEAKLTLSLYSDMFMDVGKAVV